VAEVIGLALLEAQACGVPVVAGVGPVSPRSSTTAVPGN